MCFLGCGGQHCLNLMTIMGLCFFIGSFFHDQFTFKGTNIKDLSVDLFSEGEAIALYYHFIRRSAVEFWYVIPVAIPIVSMTCKLICYPNFLEILSIGIFFILLTRRPLYFVYCYLSPKISITRGIFGRKCW
jgi:hypothetical protein